MSVDRCVLGDKHSHWRRRIPVSPMAGVACLLALLTARAFAQDRGADKPETGFVTGSVVGPAGNPLAGAEVAVLTWDEMKREIVKWAVTHTNEQGQFKLEKLNTDRLVWLKVEAPPYASETFTARAAVKEPKPVSVRLQEAGVVIGQLMNADTGEPFTGIPIRVQVYESGVVQEGSVPQSYSAELTTDVHGEFRVPGIHPGNYQVLVYADHLSSGMPMGDGTYQAMVGSSAPATAYGAVHPKEETRLSSLRMFSGGRLVVHLGPPETVKAFQEALRMDKDKRRTSPGLAVGMLRKGLGYSSTTGVTLTEDHRPQAVWWFPPGKYTLDLTVEGIPVKQKVEADIRTLQDVTVDLVMPMPVVVSGRVVDGQGRPVEKVLVSAVGPPTVQRQWSTPEKMTFRYLYSEGIGQVRTGRDGMFRIPLPAVEKVKICASASGYRAETKEIDTKGRRTASLGFQLERLPSGRISVSLTTPEGKPVGQKRYLQIEIAKVRWQTPGQIPLEFGATVADTKEVEITASDSGDWQIDNEGHVVLRGIIPRDYYMRVSAVGDAVSDYQWVRVLDGQETSVKFTFKPAQTLMVKLIDRKTRTPLQEANLLLCEGDVDEVTVVQALGMNPFPHTSWTPGRPPMTGGVPANTALTYSSSAMSNGRISYRNTSPTDEAGTFRMSRPQGRFALMARGNGYTALVRCFDKAPEAQQPLVLELTPAPFGSVRVQLVDENRTPVAVPNVQYQLVPTGGVTAWSSTRRPEFEGVGQFNIEGVQPGTYFLLVTAPNRKAKSAPSVEVNAGETLEVQVVMQ